MNTWREGGVQDAQRRGNSRLRRLYTTAVTSVLSRFGSIGVLLLTVPMALSHLGAERFGMWMVISSLGALMAFADLGIGNGILNRVAEADGRDDMPGIVAAVSIGTISLSALGAVLAVAAVGAAVLFDWATFFNVTSAVARSEAAYVALAFLLCFAIGVPAGLASKVQLGLQQGYETNLWVGAGGILSFVMVVATIKLNLGTPALVVSLFGSQQLAMLANTVIFFVFRRPDLRPKLAALNRAETSSIVRIGGAFFLIQIVALVSFRIDALFVTQFAGPQQAGVYATTERLFSIIALVSGVFLTPLWPAYGEAVGRHDLDWVRAILWRSVLVSIAFTGFAGLAILIGHRWIFWLWVGGRIDPPLLLLTGFMVFKILESVGVALSMFLNATNTLRAQIWLAVAMGAVATGAKLFLLPHLGVFTTIWITSVVYLILGIIPSAILVRSVYGRLRGTPVGSGSLSSPKLPTQ